MLLLINVKEFVAEGRIVKPYFLFSKGHMYRWLRDILSRRSVGIQKSCSGNFVVKSGTSQFSIMNPLLFSFGHNVFLVGTFYLEIGN